MKSFTIFFTLIMLLTSACFASEKIKLKEKDYQNVWCNKANGITEYVLPDKTRIDCLTDTHAIEFDFAKKWGESIEQALYYGFCTKKHPE